jgi:hypothetical protein
MVKNIILRINSSKSLLKKKKEKKKETNKLNYLNTTIS